MNCTEQRVETELNRVHNPRGMSKHNMWENEKKKRMLALYDKAIPLVRKSTEEMTQYKVIQREKRHSQTGSVRILRKVIGNSKVNGVIVGLSVNGMRENEGIFWSKRLKFSVDEVRLLKG